MEQCEGELACARDTGFGLANRNLPSGDSPAGDASIRTSDDSSGSNSPDGAVLSLIATHENLGNSSDVSCQASFFPTKEDFATLTEAFYSLKAAFDRECEESCDREARLMKRIQALTSKIETLTASDDNSNLELRPSEAKSGKEEPLSSSSKTRRRRRKKRSRCATGPTDTTASDESTAKRTGNLSVAKKRTSLAHGRSSCRLLP